MEKDDEGEVARDEAVRYKLNGCMKAEANHLLKEPWVVKRQHSLGRGGVLPARYISDLWSAPTLHGLH